VWVLVGVGLWLGLAPRTHGLFSFYTDSKGPLESLVFLCCKKVVQGVSFITDFKLGVVCSDGRNNQSQATTTYHIFLAGFEDLPLANVLMRVCSSSTEYSIRARASSYLFV
jgi:hypothetical protein